jgi:dipeptidyl aminopeptidase/acylaminoacyl peptidase
MARIPNALLVATALLLPTAALAAADDDLATAVGRLARVGRCGSPSFSPDASELAVVCDLSGIPQVWRVAREGGWPRQVTAFEDQVSGVEWSPAGDRLAFSMSPGGGMNQQIWAVGPDGHGPRRLTDGGRDNNWLGDWERGGALLTLSSNRRDPASMDAWAWDTEAGGLRLLAENPGIGTVADVSRDGLRMVLWRMESRSDDNLVLRDLASGAEHLLTPHQPPGSFGGGVFSPDGSAVYLVSNAGRDREAFARVALGADGRPGPLEVLAERDDAGLEDFALSENGRWVALVWNVAGRNEIDLRHLQGMVPAPGPELPGEIVGSVAFSPDPEGRYLVMTLSGSALPTDVWVFDRQEQRLSQVTHSPHPGVDLGALVRPRLVRYPAHDGLELTGWLYEPPGASRPAPWVLSFHGGPEGQERPAFRSDYQALLARGIGVFAPNVRGSAGFGKRFVNLDNGEKRFDAIRDIESSVGYLVGAGLADPGRLGIMGGSYGGYMTMAGIAWYPEMFAAAANLFGVVNFATFFEQTEPWMAAISKVEYGDPATQADLLRQLSPIHRLDAVVTPTLVLHGANDTNVPVVEAEQVVARLEARGVPVRYVLFPDEGHGFRKTANRVTSAVALVEWFEEHLGEPDPATRAGERGSGPR